MVTQDTTNPYRLKVTAGTDYDPKTLHQVVPVNGKTVRIENEHAIVSLCVRIKDYTGNTPALIQPKNGAHPSNRLS
jgi:hypothetical protein